MQLVHKTDSSAVILKADRLLPIVKKLHDIAASTEINFVVSLADVELALGREIEPITWAQFVTQESASVHSTIDEAKRLAKLLVAGPGTNDTMTLTTAKLYAKDRRMAAMHEAGHMVIARWAGIRPVGAWICQKAEVPDLELKGFGGQCVYYTHHLARLSQIRRMMIGVAGAMAEAVWENKFINESIYAPDVLYLGDAMSDTDWPEGTSPDEWPVKLERASEKVVDLLENELRQDWLDVGRCLIRTGICVVGNDDGLRLDVSLRLARARAAMGRLLDGHGLGDRDHQR